MERLSGGGARRPAADPAAEAETEMGAWKRLLPAFAERCRATWTHGANCEYRVVQPDGTVRWRVPRRVGKGPGEQNDPLCACGRGKEKVRIGKGEEVRRETYWG